MSYEYEFVIANAQWVEYYPPRRECILCIRYERGIPEKLVPGRGTRDARPYIGTRDAGPL